MALFVVRHTHPAERCPAKDPEVAPTLLNLLGRANCERFGVNIHGEAVAKGEHTFYLILEAPDEGRVRQFISPFAQAGGVDVYPASTCSAVLAAGSCTATDPGYELESVLDPGEACQRAIESELIVRSVHPLNCETSISALIGAGVMPNAHFYLRNHFHIPRIDSERYRLRVGGLVRQPLTLSISDLHSMPSHSQTVTLECAGNGRAYLEPRVPGERWELGAVSTAEWTGVRLLELLARAGVQPQAKEVLFRGADDGTVKSEQPAIRFERSLQLDDPSLRDAFVAYAMNGEPLPIWHGYPIRLIVPCWYAVASVKWLTEIELLEAPFQGFFQADRYWYQWNEGERAAKQVTLQNVRSIISEPGEDQRVPRGMLAIRGMAWSGWASIARVEVSIAGSEWQEARVLGDGVRGSWQRWELLARFEEMGVFRIKSRATDQNGNVQPDAAEWNRLGYGNNSIQTISIRVE